MRRGSFGNLWDLAGKCLALVGVSGSGEMTVVKLLTRLYDSTEEQIYLGGIDI
jgi:ABC-type multidrug transport system fused ATPase/permease subunit